MFQDENNHKKYFADIKTVFSLEYKDSPGTCNPDFHVHKQYEILYCMSNNMFCETDKSREKVNADTLMLFSSVDLPQKALTVFLPSDSTLKNITVDTVSANVELMGGSADTLTVSTTSGGITGPGLPAREYSFSTVSGDIFLSVLPAGGSSITCETVSGEASIDCSAPPETVSFSGVSGGLCLTLPEGSCRYELDFETVSGDRVTDCFVSGGEDTCRISAATVSGDVELRTVGKAR